MFVSHPSPSGDPYGPPARIGPDPAPRLARRDGHRPPSAGTGPPSLPSPSLDPARAPVRGGPGRGRRRGGRPGAGGAHRPDRRRSAAGRRVGRRGDPGRAPGAAVDVGVAGRHRHRRLTRLLVGHRRGRRPGPQRGGRGRAAEPPAGGHHRRAGRAGRGSHPADRVLRGAVAHRRRGRRPRARRGVAAGHPHRTTPRRAGGGRVRRLRAGGRGRSGGGGGAGPRPRQRRGGRGRGRPRRHPGRRPARGRRPLRPGHPRVRLGPRRGHRALGPAGPAGPRAGPAGRRPGGRHRFGELADGPGRRGGVDRALPAAAGPGRPDRPGHPGLHAGAGGPLGRRPRPGPPRRGGGGLTVAGPPAGRPGASASRPRSTRPSPRRSWPSARSRWLPGCWAARAPAATSSTS